MKTFTKQNLSTIRSKLSIKMAEFEKETGVRISLGNISYQNDSFTSKISAKLVNGKSESDIQRDEFEKNCMLYGFTKLDYKKTAMLQGRNFELVGFKPRARKNNAIMKCVSTGKQFVTNVSEFKKQFTLKNCYTSQEDNLTKKEAVKTAMEFYAKSIEEEIMDARNPRTEESLRKELAEFRKHM